MTPPDSDAHEVRLQMALAVLREMAEPQPAIAVADTKTRAHWMQSCARHALVKLSDAARPDFSLIRKDLAQRILAALEDPDGPGCRPAALAAELREHIKC